MARCAGSNDRPLAPRGASCLPITALTLTVIAIPLLALIIIVGELVGIERLAATVREGALPTAIAQQKRAIWTETLRNAAKVVAYAPERTIRKAALAKAEQLAQNLKQVADPAQAEALRAGMAAIRGTARATNEAQDHDAAIRAMLRAADEVISDMSANLTSIVEDSADTLARLIETTLAEGAQGQPGYGLIDEVLALNTSSRDLLASLDQGRLLLAAARTMEEPSALEQAAARFTAIAATLRARVGTLRGNSDYEYLPEMIARFNELAAIFDLRIKTLAEQAKALQSRQEAERALARLREDLSAEAIAAAERSVEALAGDSRDISTQAIVMLVLGALALLVMLAVGKSRCDGSLARDHGINDEPDSAFDAVAALVGVFARFLREQHNLERWSRCLEAYLENALGELAARRAGPAAAEQIPEQARRLVDETQTAITLSATAGYRDARRALEEIRTGECTTSVSAVAALNQLVEQLASVGTGIGLLLARLNAGVGERPSLPEIERHLGSTLEQVTALRSALAGTASSDDEQPSGTRAVVPVHAAA